MITRFDIEWIQLVLDGRELIVTVIQLPLLVLGYQFRTQGILLAALG